MSIEPLEDRRLLSLIVVDIAADEADGNYGAGDLSLREAIQIANSDHDHDTIKFDSDLAGSVITLSSEVQIKFDLTIDGPGADQLTISGNNASGIFEVGNQYYRASTVVIRGLSLEDGRAGTGGAILHDYGHLTVDRCTLANNLATRYGGAIESYGSSLVVTNSTLASNSAGTRGGGIYRSGSLTVTNSTLADNSAGTGGGGISYGYGSLTVTNSTLANNSAGAEGGGILNSGALSIGNSILGGNSAPSGPDLLDSGTIAFATNNVIQSPSGHSIVTGYGNWVGYDPRLDPAGLQNNGGPTETIALMPGSVAIDWGHDTPLTNDQRGDRFHRKFGSAVDVGAYEVQTLNLQVDTHLDENDGDFSAGDLSLREAIALADANPGADTIQFDAGLAGHTITLTSGQLRIYSDLTIEGLGADQLTVSGNNEGRIFAVDDADPATITVAIRGLSLNNANSENDGGAIYNNENLTVDHCTLAGNTADGRSGGAIHNTGTLTVTSSTLVHNVATNGGGINNAGALTVANSTLAYNRAFRGGGIRNVGTLTVTNATLAGNEAVLGSAGGGIYNAGTLTVTSSTLANNSAGHGGGIYNLSSLTLANSILGDNKPGHGRDLWNDGTIAAARYNIIENGDGHSIANSDGNQVGVDPGLDPNGLLDHGGPTQTIALLPTSLAIDAGKNELAVHLEFDQRGEGFDRIFGETVNPTVDVGAFEFQLIVSTLSDVDDADYQWEQLSLREALELAAQSPRTDVIRFAPLLAGGTITTSAQLTINSDVDLWGGNVTIDGGKTWTRRVLYVPSGVEATIRDLTITGGYLANYPGGGIRNDGTLTVVGSTISGNKSTTSGGGIYNHSGGRLDVVDSTISDNESTTSGGGISNHGTLTVEDSTISDNSAQFGGGGIVNYQDSSLTVLNSTISDNSIDEAGGGIFSYGELLVVGTEIARNSADQSGGGIYNASGGRLDVLNSTISRNSAVLHGGGIENRSTDSTVVNSTISNNSCGYSGGGILNWNNGELAVVNSTIVQNTADGNNDGEGAGGGIRTRDGSFTTLHNTIVAGNVCGIDSVDDDLVADDLSGDVVLLSSHNLIGDAATADGVVAGNSNIVGVEHLSWLLPLGDYGGPTQTHALLPTSPAIHAGNNLFAADLEFDQRGEGFGRIAGDDVDIGAFEFALVVSTDEDVDDGNERPGYLSLREALRLAETIPGKDEIRFDLEEPKTIQLTPDPDLSQYELVITSNVDLVGPGVTIRGVHGIRVLYVLPEVTDASIDGLTITGGYYGGSGGGIVNLGTLAVTNSTIKDNASNWTGGGIFNMGTLRLVNSTVSDNETLNGSYSGGGIRNEADGTLWVVNSTISGNRSAALGGGIFNYGTLSVVNSTVAENVADAYDTYTHVADVGGGIANYGDGSVTLHNSIVAGNVRGAADQPPPDDLSGPDVHPSSSHNLVGDADSSGGLDAQNGNLIGVDPLLDPAGLQDHGGPTHTIALMPGSPAVNGGNNDEAPKPGEGEDEDWWQYDQRGAGFARIVHTTVDIGAFEVQNDPPTAEIVGPRDGVPGQPIPFTLTASDLPPADQSAGFAFKIDWDGDGHVDETVSDLTGVNVDHVYTETGSYTVRVTATDNDGGTSEEVTHEILISPAVASGGVLTFGGTPGDDVMTVESGSIIVTLNGQSWTFSDVDVDRVVVYGQDGHDQILVTIPKPCELHGDAGNDTLQGGSGDDVLDGGPGDDQLLGGGGDDALAGGGGDDHIDGQEGSDTVEAGDGNDTVTTDADDDLGDYTVDLVGPVSITEGIHAVRGQTVTLAAGFPAAGSSVDWDFGDAVAANGASVSHVYTSEGTYQLDVTITDPSGQTTTIMRDLEIGIVALQVDPSDTTTTVLAVGGTVDDDTIVFNPGGSIQVLINGQSYGAFEPTGRVLAFGQSGDDNIQVAGGIALSAWLYGDAGDDRLHGGAGNDCLLGGTGYDYLLGGRGDDLLIGGYDPDQLVGNAGSDILVGAATIYDSSPDSPTNDGALMAILTEWNASGDPEAIRSTWLEPGTHVLDDGASDRLTGSSGLDWFFADLDGQDDDDDELTDQIADEVVDLLFSP